MSWLMRRVKIHICFGSGCCRLRMEGRVRYGARVVPPDKKRLLVVLDLAAQKGDWGKPLEPKQGAKRGRGIACTTSYAYLAQVAEVTVENDTIRVDRLVTAVDCGQVVNPNGARSQLEGGMLMTLSSIVKEAITIRNGAVVEQNFDDYSVLRMPEAPRLETWFIENHEKPHGAGRGGSGADGAGGSECDLRGNGKAAEEDTVPDGRVKTGTGNREKSRSR